MLIRPRAWWYNKVPVTLTLLLVLADARGLTYASIFALLAVVLAVCAVANFGYAINEIYDIREDAAIGRNNTAAAMGVRRVAAIALASAVLAVALSWAIGRAVGSLLTVAELCLPIAYSYPALRLKEKKWLGVMADAAAAHVYPAMLALVAAACAGLRPITPFLIGAAVVWSLATGLRGILSHQLKTADQDAVGGLYTVVHQFGPRKLVRFVVAVLLPLEVLGFGAVLIACDVGVLAWAAVVFYFVYEIAKLASGRFSVVAFQPKGQAYIPLVEDSFYKAWAPTLLPLELSRQNALWLIFIPCYCVLFRPLVEAEGRRLSALIQPSWGSFKQRVANPRKKP